MNHTEQAINWWGLGSQYNHNPALGWMIITFIIFILLLRHYIRPHLKTYFKSRSQQIKQALEEAQQAKLEAERKLKNYQQRLEHLDEELANIKRSYQQQAEAEKQRIEQAAQQLSVIIAKDAEEAIMAQYKKATTKLQNEVVRLSISEARKNLAVTANKDLEQNYFKQFVADVKNL